MAPSHLVRFRRRKRRRDSRGVALVMVLGAITVLTVFLTELQEDTSAELSSAIAERDELKAEYLARSAVNLSRMLIVTGPKIEAAVGPMLMLLGMKTVPQIPVWEFNDMVLGPFNDPAYAGSNIGGMNLDPTTAKNLGVNGGHFELSVVDEDSKININTAARGSPIDDDRVGAALSGLMAGTQYDEMFQERDPDGQFSDRATICGAIVDWADPDENAYACNLTSQGPSNSGSEDNIYQSLNLPYQRKNAAFDSLEELRLVRGVSDSFWSTFIDPDPSDPHKRVLTVWGQGKLNVNNANAQTIYALLCSPNILDTPGNDVCTDPVQAEAFLGALTLVKGFTTGIPMFGTWKDFVKFLQAIATATSDQAQSSSSSSSSSSGGATASPLGAMGSVSDMLGPIFSGLGLKPIKLKAPNDMKNYVDTRSRIFSIYADGVVPGYRRKTKVRIHAVIDMRGAAQLTQGGALTVAGGNPQTNTTSSTSSTSTTPTQLAAPNANGTVTIPPGPGGTIIYWRIE